MNFYLVLRFYPGKVLREICKAQTYAKALMQVDPGNDCMKVEVVELGEEREIQQEMGGGNFLR